MWTGASSKSVRPMTWDPKSPLCLLVPTMQEGKVLLGNFYASDGIGVHPSETSALLQILTGSQQAKANSQSEPQPQRSYRSILNSCLEEFLQDTEHPIEFASLELFKLMYAITHLTETHILRTPTMADTVSYLRHHHMETLLIQEFLETTSHPEEHEEYWTLLRKLVIRGCLSDAWSVLTYHSACQRAAMENPLSASSSREIIASPYSNTNALAYSRERDRHGFAALREILERAPIPGGRTDLYDIEQNDGDDDDEEDRNNISANLFKNKSFMSGVHQKDYQLWNTNPSAALATWRMWQSQVTSFSSVGGVGSFLLNREPRLIPLLQMMHGDLSSIPFEDWSEALCAELLYIRPNLRPEDLPVRLSRSMQRMGQTDSCSLILAILEGDYGAIVESLYTKLGGGSGAALPATMTSLLCNLLMKAKRIPESAKDIQINLLLEAAEAILSSHSNPDIGMRLVAHLLVPHCSANNDLRIVSTLAEALEHHIPQSDSEAQLLLDIVRPLISKKRSERILDGCLSMIAGRYRQLIATKSRDSTKQNSKIAMNWLLVGAELEAEMFDKGICFRLIVIACRQSSSKLLQHLLGNEPWRADVIEVSKGFSLALTDKMEDVESVRLLHSMSTMAVAVAEQSSDRTSIVAHEIGHCLRRGLAPPTMHRDLLNLAKSVLDYEDALFTNGNHESTESSFSVDDMQALMENFLHLTTLSDTKLWDVKDQMNLALGKGLMRAFLTENKKLQKRKAGTSDTAPSRLITTNLESYTYAEQESLVASMLDL